MIAQPIPRGQQREPAHGVANEASLRRPIGLNRHVVTITCLFGTLERTTRGISIRNCQPHLFQGIQEVLQRLLRLTLQGL